METSDRAYLFHKLRGPLAVVKSALSLVLEGRTGETTPETKKLLQQAFDKSQELINFIDEMEQAKTDIHSG